MKHHIVRQCKGCPEVLSDAAHPNQKYCSVKCRQREKVRRYRLRRVPDAAERVSRLETIEQDFEILKDEFKTFERNKNELLAARDLKIRRLEHALKRAEHQVEVAANEQAERTRSVRDELALANNEVANLRRNWSPKNAAATSSQEATELRERLASVTERYNSLVAKYRELSEAAQYAATERTHLQGIVRQWDGMCVRLYKATGGRPKKAADKKVLATWSQFRKLVRK